MKYLKSLGLFFLSFVILNIIISLLSYFEIFNPVIIKIIKIIFIIISTLISSIYLGLKSNKKGYLEGLKLGLLIISIFLILNLIFKGFNKFTIIYYLLIIGITILGSILGINRKKAK